MADFKYYSLKNAHQAHGVVIVIDVLRAFTTAAFAFEAGALKIHPVGETEEALILRELSDDRIIMGEVNGAKPEGFDFGNSPYEINKANLTGKIMIQRTSAGTQGVVKAVNADCIIAASFVVAKATVQYIRGLNPKTVSFIVTGETMDLDGDEDRACGEYIEALFADQKVDSKEFIKRVKLSSVGKYFLEEKPSYNLREDLFMSIQVNKFNFCMPVHQEANIFSMECFQL